MIARMTSRELSAWSVLLDVQQEEAFEAQMRSTSQDGQVVITGLDDDEDDEDEDDEEGRG